MERYADPEKVLADTIFLTVAGSRSYGTATVNSDTDRRGIFVARNMWHYAGLEMNPITHINRWPWPDTEDTTVYEARHAIRLMLKANLTLIELLFMPREHWMISSPAWEHMVTNRACFLTKRLYQSCRGFAWNSAQAMMKPEAPSPHGRRYALIQEHGYDTKAAAHAVRIMAMCRDLFITGTLSVQRPHIEATYLQSVRAGKFRASEIWHDLQALEMQASAALQQSDLPDNPNADKVDAIWRDVFNLQMGGAW